MRTFGFGPRFGCSRWALHAAVCCAAAACFAAPAAVLAQDAPPEAAAKPAKGKRAKAAGPAVGPSQSADGAAPKDPAAALASYNTGVKAYQAAKYDQAIQSLNVAVNGGLATQQMAKALYYRGASYQHQGQSGQAISDLTSALFFKPGLDESERASALSIRGAAYKSAGLDDTGASVARMAGPTETGAVPPTSSRMSATTASEQQGSGSGPLSGVGNFFGGLFGGSSSQEAKPAAPPEPAPVAVAAAAPATAGGEAEVLPWANRPVTLGAAASSSDAASEPAPAPAVKKVAAAPKKPVKKAAVAAAAPAAEAGAPATAGAKVRIQVASVKSRDEASAIIAKVKKLGGGLASAPTDVDESAFGGSTFYRVKVGPFANAASAQAPCKALKAGGLDCLVTAE